MYKKLQTNTVILVLSISVGIANAWHVITQWITNPPDRYFTGIAHYYGDYFLYVSQITQGMRGNWIFAKHMYTNELLPATWVYWPNVLMGKIGGVFTESPFTIYNVLLMFLIMLLLVLLWHIVHTLFPKQPATQISAFLFLGTASNFADMKAWLTHGTYVLLGNTWFSPTPALNRFGGVPHQTLQTIFLLAVILIFSKIITIRTQSTGFFLYSVLFIFLCFLAATLSPTQMVLVCLTFGIMVGIERKYFLKNIPHLLTVSLGIGAAGLGAFLVHHAFDASQLFATSKAWEASQTQSVSVPAFLWAMGPMIFFIPMGVHAYIKKYSAFKTILFLYGMLSLIVFFSPIPLLFGTSNTRWIHPASYMLFPILAAAGLTELSKFLSQNISKISKRAPRHSINRFSLFFFLLTFTYLMLTIPALLAQIDARSHKVTAPVLYGDLNHVPYQVIRSMKIIRNLPNQNVVLTDPALPYDVLIPIFTGKPSFTGHILHTLYAKQKELLRQKFFQGSMTDAEAKQFLIDHTIGSIMQSSGAHAMLRYPFLVQSVQNEIITVYTVRL